MENQIKALIRKIKEKGSENSWIDLPELKIDIIANLKEFQRFLNKVIK